MQRPTWAKIVGVLGIIFGIFGLLGSGCTAMMPKMIHTYKEVMSVDWSQNNPKDQAEVQQIKTIFDKTFGRIPNWISPVSMIIGFIGLLANSIYVYAAIEILLLKNHGVKLLYATASTCILLNVTRGAIYFKALSFMGTGVLFYGLAGVVIDLILLAVVATGKKDAFA